MESVLVWDIPTRLFHWLFALTFTVAFFTAEEDGWAGVHVFVGLLMFGLLIYRLVWGVVGSRYARFSSFLFSPAQAMHYLSSVLSGKAERHIGHSPAGSWAIYLMLLLGVVISMFGLATLSAGERFKELHEALSYAALMVVVVHLTGVAAASMLHRENLPRAMVTGRKQGQEPQGIRSVRPVAALLLLALVASFSVSYWKGWDSQTQSVTLPFLSQPLALDGHGREHEEGHSTWLAEED